MHPVCKWVYSSKSFLKMSYQSKHGITWSRHLLFYTGVTKPPPLYVDLKTSCTSKSCTKKLGQYGHFASQLYMKSYHKGILNRYTVHHPDCFSMRNCKIIHREKVLWAPESIFSLHLWPKLFWITAQICRHALYYKVNTIAHTLQLEESFHKENTNII